MLNHQHSDPDSQARIADKVQQVTDLRQAHMEEIYQFWHSLRAGKVNPAADWCRLQFDMYLLKTFGGGPFTTFANCYVNRDTLAAFATYDQWRDHIRLAHETVLKCDALPAGPRLARLESILSTSGIQYFIYAWCPEGEEASGGFERVRYLKGVFDKGDAFQVLDADCGLLDHVVFSALQLKRLVGDALSHDDLMYPFLTDYPSTVRAHLAAAEGELSALTANPAYAA